MRVEDKEGASMQAGHTIEMKAEVASLLREMRDGNEAIRAMVAQMQLQNQKQSQDNQQAMDLVVQQNQKLEQQRKDDLASLQQQRKDDLANIQQQLRDQQQQSAGAPSNAQGGPAPPAGQAPRKRGRPPKSASAGSAGASSKKAALANKAKRDRASQDADPVQAYPDEEKTKDEAMQFCFEPWKTNIDYHPNEDAWFVQYSDKRRYDYVIRSPYVSFEQACYLRRELCLSKKDRDENAKNLWTHLKNCAKPQRLYNLAVKKFAKKIRGSN